MSNPVILRVAVESEGFTVSVDPQWGKSLLPRVFLASPERMTGTAFLQDLADLAPQPPDGIRANRLAIITEMLTGLPVSEINAQGGVVLKCAQQVGLKNRLPVYESWDMAVPFFGHP